MTATIKKFELSLAEYEHLVTTLEGSREEFEELMREVSWFTTESVDRIETALQLIKEKAAYE